MAITIADRVWSAGETEAEKFDEPVVHLELLTASDAVEALRESVSEVRPSTPEQDFAGEWDWARLDDGVPAYWSRSRSSRATTSAPRSPQWLTACNAAGVVGSIDVSKSSSPVTASNEPGAIHFAEIHGLVTRSCCVVSEGPGIAVRVRRSLRSTRRLAVEGLSGTLCICRGLSRSRWGSGKDYDVARKI